MPKRHRLTLPKKKVKRFTITRITKQPPFAARLPGALGMQVSNRFRTIIETVDDEHYEVECIIDHKLEGRSYFYKVKWVGYDNSHNTDEEDWRMNCDEKLVLFAKSVVKDPNYASKVPTLLNSLHQYMNNPVVLLKGLDTLSIFASTVVHCGSVKFVDMDSVGSRCLLMEYIKTSNQNHLLHTADIPTDDKIVNDSDRYAKELQYRLTVFPEHPVVNVLFPTGDLPVFYSPPALSQLLFEPITLEMYNEKDKLEHIIVEPSQDLGFNHSKVFLDEQYINKERSDDEDPFLYKAHPVDGPTTHAVFYDGMNRIDYRSDPRFGVNLNISQEVGPGWVLRANHGVTKGTPIMLMTGVITPSSTSDSSLMQQGERVAFSSFVEIPGTDKCLDRRFLHDFSRYIPHSCNPTCAVRLVESINPYPDLVIYAKCDITEEMEFEISLDWYKGFEEDVKNFFKKNKKIPEGKVFTLYEKRIDFVQCLCGESNCREVLYVDRSRSFKNKDMPKAEKLMDMDPEFNFRGLSVHESDHIWKVEEGFFV